MEGKEENQGLVHNTWNKAIEYKQQYLLNRAFRRLRYDVIDQVQADHRRFLDVLIFRH